MNLLFQIFLGLIGTLLIFFIPGYFLTRILWNSLSLPETIGLSVAFSLAIDIIIGLFLGANATIAEITGGLNTLNMWFYMASTTIILGTLYLIKKNLRPKK